MRSLGRLLRLSLAPSALGDATAGILFGAAAWPGGWRPWVLLLASSCVYHGGMALNDWADRDHDARTRPERPIPSGAIPSVWAAAIGVGLLAAGAGLGLLVDAGAGCVLAAVAVLALVYDLRGRGPWLGPLLLAACRAGNLGAALLAGTRLAQSEPDPRLLLPLPLLYGAYVFAVSRLGRLEDGEDDLARRRISPAILVGGIAVLLLAPLVVPVPAGDGWSAAYRRLPALLVLGAGAVGLQRVALDGRRWTPRDVGPVMGMALRRLLLFTSAVAFLSGSPAGWIGGVLLLGGFPSSHALRRVFPPS